MMNYLTIAANVDCLVLRLIKFMIVSHAATLKRATEGSLYILRGLVSYAPIISC